MDDSGPESPKLHVLQAAGNSPANSRDTARFATLPSRWARRRPYLAPPRADVPERHFDFIPVDLAAHRGGLQRFDIPARAAENVAQRLLGHRRPRKLIVGRVGIGEAAEQ